MKDIDMFMPFTHKGMTLKNRIMMSPMDQYSAFGKDGKVTDWHYVHYVSRAVGGEGQIRAWGKPGTHAAYQVPLAKKMKEALNVPIIVVGRLDDPVLANSVIGNHEADLVEVGRGMLRNPYWALESAKVLQKESDIPRQYTMGF